MDNKPVASKEEIDALDLMKSIVVDTQHLINKVKTFPPGPNGREKALVITKLQEAILWAQEDIELHHKLK